jgi:hypothetical protein
MNGPSKNNVVSLRSHQENSEKRAYDRLPGEKAVWYQRFQLYCRLGRQRSVQAVLEIEQAGNRQALLGTKKHIYDDERRFDAFQELRGSAAGDVEKPQLSIPGAWKRQCVNFQWVERAQAWDVDQRREWENRIDTDIRLDAEFTSRQYRIWILNSYAMFMQKMVTENIDKVSFSEKIAAVKLTQSILKDIRQEMDALEAAGPGR